MLDELGIGWIVLGRGRYIISCDSRMSSHNSAPRISQGNASQIGCEDVSAAFLQASDIYSHIPTQHGSAFICWTQTPAQRSVEQGLTQHGKTPNLPRLSAVERQIQLTLCGNFAPYSHRVGTRPSWQACTGSYSGCTPGAVAGPEHRVGNDFDQDLDSLDEVVMAVNLTERGTMGCAYYAARTEKLYFMEDVKFGSADVVESPIRRPDRYPRLYQMLGGCP
ncbi:hypothetical protein KC357_g169 [Hortaea werneckii]|nr:hypothetical protein KC357_g169 [Hortaea werneckii]